MKVKAKNDFNLYILVLLLGAVTGAVLWVFLKAVGLCTTLLWDTLPKAAGVRWLPIVVCALGGLAAGLIRKRYGDYPEELHVVLGKIKRDKHYDYGPMPVILVCAFLPLVFGASVGPEAGLTGIIAGLCYWIGDNVKYAKEHVDEYSEIGAAATLAGLFHVPLFGIFAVEENAAGDEHDGSFSMPKTSKLLLYGLSTASAFLVMKGLGAIFGAAGEGFPSYEAADATGADYALFLLYVPIGFALFAAFSYSEKLTGAVSAKLPSVARETVCGLCIGVMALLVPEVLFSGEEQMGLLPDSFVTYAPAALMGICLLKIFMTALCIQFGLKGGHFFPLIYACSCMGFGLAALVFESAAGLTDTGAIAGHAVFAAAVITAAALGAQLRKPIAVSMLLLICFPLRMILWIFLAAALGSRISAALAGKQDAGSKTGRSAKKKEGNGD